MPQEHSMFVIMTPYLHCTRLRRITAPTQPPELIGATNKCLLIPGVGTNIRSVIIIWKI